MDGLNEEPLFSGPFVAIVTPFSRTGQIDYEALKEYLQFLTQAGVQNILTNGTTGEFPSLTGAERNAITAFCRTRFGGRIVNHVSDCSLANCLEYLQTGDQDADGSLVLPPYYYAQPDPAGVQAFFERILETAKHGVFLYNFPKHTQFTITPQLLSALARRPTLIGIKDSAGDWQASLAFKKAAERLLVYVGSDRRVLDVLRSGLDGSVTGGGNPVPEFLVNVHGQFVGRDTQAAEETQKRLDSWTTWRKRLPFSEIAVAKSALAARIKGFPRFVRPPLVPVDPDTDRAIRTFMRETILPVIDAST